MTFNILVHKYTALYFLINDDLVYTIQNVVILAIIFGLFCKGIQMTSWPLSLFILIALSLKFVPTKLFPINRNGYNITIVCR